MTLPPKYKRAFAVIVAAIYLMIAVTAATCVIVAAKVLGATGWFLVMVVVVAFTAIALFAAVLWSAMTGDV